MNKINKVILGLLVLSLGLFVGCTSKENGKENTPVNENNNVVEAPDNAPIATIKVKGYGEIKAELLPNIAPETVNNFISLANTGFYDGLIFHRVISGFMIQGGCPDGIGTGGPGYNIKGEFSKNGIENNLAHTKGVLSMARSNDPNSGGSQFFIMTEDSPHLNGEYAAFGRVIEGQEIVDQIENVKTNKSNDKPLEDIVIESIKVDTKGEKYPEPNKM